VFHVKHEGWTSGELSSAQIESLGRYEELLVVQAVPRGMVAASDAGHLQTRHILDSLRAIAHLSAATERIVDLGSGAGLPGLPIAVACPHLEVTLAEPRQARAAFLELTVQTLRLPNVRVFPGPAEELAAGFDVCLARGFGDARKSWIVARDLLVPGGDLVYWAGRTFESDDTPPDARVRAVGEPTLESGGPIVIMTRQ
jgi:16S rRNA (guanine527-N7)-methyltransferase